MSLDQDDLIAAWELEDTYTEDDDGNKTPALSNDPIGHIMYTADGYMAAMMGLGDRQLPATGANEADKAAAFGSYITYADRWALRDNVGRFF